MRRRMNRTSHNRKVIQMTHPEAMQEARLEADKQLPELEDRAIPGAAQVAHQLPGSQAVVRAATI